MMDFTFPYVPQNTTGGHTESRSAFSEEAACAFLLPDDHIASAASAITPVGEKWEREGTM